MLFAQIEKNKGGDRDFGCCFDLIEAITSPAVESAAYWSLGIVCAIAVILSVGAFSMWYFSKKKPPGRRPDDE